MLPVNIITPPNFFSCDSTCGSCICISISSSCSSCIIVVVVVIVVDAFLVYYYNCATAGK